MAKSVKGSQNIGVFRLLKFFSLSKSEIDVYNILSKKQMTIKQLQRTTKMSERSLRTHLDVMVEKKFITRKLVEGKHLKYLYHANSGDNILDSIKKNIDDIEKSRQKKRSDILKGTEEAIEG